MLLSLLAAAFAQSAAPAASAAAPDEGPAGSSWLESDEDLTLPPPGPGDLEAPGYCSRRARARNVGPMEEGVIHGVWSLNGREARSDSSGDLPVDRLAALRARGMNVCVEVSIGVAGSYTARSDVGMARAQSLYDQVRWGFRKGGGFSMAPAAPVAESDGPELEVGLMITEDPDHKAGELVYAAWTSAESGAPAVASAPESSAPSPTGGWNYGTDWAAAVVAPTQASPKPAVATLAPVVVAPTPVTAAPLIVATPAARLSLPSIDGRLATGRVAKNESAVVIGLEDYAFVPDVPYARRDAEAFYNFLLYTRGIPRDRITMITAGSVEHVRKAVDDAGKSVTAGGTVWVYFAGHGAASPSSREQVVLGDDVRPDDVSFDARSVPVAEIQTRASAGGGSAMLVVDACFSGVGRDGSSLLGGHRTLIPAKAIQAVVSARQWTATTAGEASVPLDSVQHGAFTYAAIGALRGWADGEFGAKDGKVTADEADAYVSRLLRAVQIREQTPSFMGGRDVVLSEGAKEVGPLVE